MIRGREEDVKCVIVPPVLCHVQVESHHSEESQQPALTVETADKRKNVR